MSAVSRRQHPDEDGDPALRAMDAAVASLSRDIDALLESTADERLVALRWAARLASLGSADRLHALLPPRGSETESRLIEVHRALLVDLALELDQAAGEQLALALIDAQDAACLRAAWQAAQESWGDAWVAVSEASLWAALDEEAASLLGIWIEQFPIPEELRLEPMLAPLGPALRTLIATSARLRPEQIVELRRTYPSSEIEQLPRLAASDERPSKHVIGLTDRKGRLLDDDVFLDVHVRLDEDWTLVVVLEGVAPAVDAVQVVHIQGRPLAPSGRLSTGDRTTRAWSLPLRGRSLEDRLSIIEAPVSVGLGSGARVRCVPDGVRLA